MKIRNFELGQSSAQDWIDASLALLYTTVREEILLSSPTRFGFSAAREHSRFCAAVSRCP